jgi:hypothetical protein
MADTYEQGIFFSSADAGAEIRNSIYVVAANWYVNRCPLVTRAARSPVGSTKFSIINRHYRPRTQLLAAAVADTSGTTITVTDASLYMNGDVIDLGNGEYVEIASDPNVTANTISVFRGASATTPATQSNGATITLVGNSRTGGEVNQSGIALLPVPVWQYCQTFQHPVQVGGSLQATTDFQTQPGTRTPFDQYKMDALQNLMDDMEFSSYYGIGASPDSYARPKQCGLKQQLIAAGTYVGSPVNSGAYKATDLIRDLLQVPRANGGAPDTLLVSSNFMTGLATWGQAAMRIDAGVNIFGTPIEVFEVPFLLGVNVIEAPLLKPFTAISLTAPHVRMRMKRNEFWLPRGIRGDAYEGDWVAEGAIEAENPQFHAWVENITAFSAT